MQYFFPASITPGLATPEITYYGPAVGPALSEIKHTARFC